MNSRQACAILYNASVNCSDRTMNLPLILLVEDEPYIAQVQLAYLKQANFRTHHLGRGDEVVDYVRANSPDLVLLDLMLPGLDGISVCRKIREFSNVPIIMITARVDEIDRLLGFDVGADDYLCKPFSPKEMVARVQAMLRRSAGRPASIQTGAKPAPTVSLLDIREAEQRATWNGIRLDLTTQQFRLLQVLASQPGRIFSRAQLIELAFDAGADVFDRVVDSHIKNLRKKLAAAAGDTELIRSVYGAGYSLELVGA
jgi:two-component system, OmpR family, response regulator BaeR